MSTNDDSAIRVEYDGDRKSENENSEKSCSSADHLYFVLENKQLMIAMKMKTPTLPIPVWGIFSPFPAVVIDISPHLMIKVTNMIGEMIRVTMMTNMIDVVMISIDNDDNDADDGAHQSESKKLQLDADPFSAK